MPSPAGAVSTLAAACLLGLWPAVLPRRAHCIQSQTPHYRRDAAKLEAVQRRAGRATWGGEGLALALAAGKGAVPARLRHLAQWDPAGNLRSSASVRQPLEKGLPSKGRNEHLEGRGGGPRHKPA